MLTILVNIYFQFEAELIFSVGHTSQSYEWPGVEPQHSHGNSGRGRARPFDRDSGRVGVMQFTGRSG